MADIPPIALSAIVCDRVVLDSRTGYLTIRDVVHTIAAHDYPATLPRLSFFFELTNGHGEVEIVVKLVEVSGDVTKDDKPLLETDPPIKITFKDVRQVVAQNLDFTNITFRSLGEYRFQLFGANTLLLERRLVCKKLEKRGSGKNEAHRNQT